MSERIKFEIEYDFKTSSALLYKRLSTAGGLQEWFANKVDRDGDTFEFTWNTNSQKAMLVEKEKKRFVKFQWIDDLEDYFFSFELERDEITNDLALIITDFAEEDDIDDTIKLWDKQIDILKRKLGM